MFGKLQVASDHGFGDRYYECSGLKVSSKSLPVSDFSPDLTQFLVVVKEFRPFLTQVEGAQAPTTEYETTPLRAELTQLTKSHLSMYFKFYFFH